MTRLHSNDRDMTETGRDLAGAITARRVELGLSKTEAARRAGVSRPTWVSWEKGTHPYDSNYRGIERALEWERGGVIAAASGSAPVPLRHEHSPPTGIDPKAWARWDPIDQEMVLNALRFAEKRAAQKNTRSNDDAHTEI